MKYLNKKMFLVLITGGTLAMSFVTCALQSFAQSNVAAEPSGSAVAISAGSGTCAYEGSDMWGRHKHKHRH